MRNASELAPQRMVLQGGVTTAVHALETDGNKEQAVATPVIGD